MLILLVVQFIYNTILQKGLKILLFKVNYSYKLKILLLPRQVKKSSKIVKERVETLIHLYKKFRKSVKLVQE